MSSPPLPQRGCLDNNNGQAKVQVLSKLPAGGELLQVPVRGRQDAGVAVNLLPAPDALEALLLEKAQELHLDRRRQPTDLVGEKRTPVGQLLCATSAERGRRRQAVHCLFERRDQTKTNSSRQVNDGAVCCQSLVRGQEDELLDLRLRDQHPIERIAMVPRKQGYKPGLRGHQWQAFEVLGGQSLCEIIPHLQFAQALLEPDLPKGDCADEHGVRRVADHLPGLNGK
jgi:hypothetical protein